MKIITAAAPSWRKFCSASLVVPLLGFLGAPAFAADFTMDKPHTQAEFVVTHLALSKVHGQIPLVTGTATLGPNDLPTAVNATFDVTGLDTHDETRDKSLRDQYFEATKFPTITFVERSATGTKTAFKLIGDLTIHGVTKRVSLDAQIDGTAVVKGKRHIAYTAATTIDRRDFGINFAPVLNGALFAGDEVTINIETDLAEN